MKRGSASTGERSKENFALGRKRDAFLFPVLQAWHAAWGVVPRCNVRTLLSHRTDAVSYTLVLGCKVNTIGLPCKRTDARTAATGGSVGSCEGPSLRTVCAPPLQTYIGGAFKLKQASSGLDEMTRGLVKFVLRLLASGLEYCQATSEDGTTTKVCPSSGLTCDRYLVSGHTRNPKQSMIAARWLKTVLRRQGCLQSSRGLRNSAMDLPTVQVQAAPLRN